MAHTFALPAVLTAETVAAAQAQLLQRLRTLPAGAVLAVDASQVQTFDSACLAMLLACRRAAQVQQQSVVVQTWASSLQSLAKVYGVLPLLDPLATAAESVAELA